MSVGSVVSTATLRSRNVDGSAFAECAFGEASLSDLFDAAPWRTFRWHLGQKHYSGSFWSATEQALVIYESRLELARLLFADFDPAVSRIVAQPEAEEKLESTLKENVVATWFSPGRVLPGRGP